MIILGLTGSIGMGKSTTAKMFAEAGIPVYSADEAVHRLYQDDAAMTLIEAAFPGVYNNGMIDRAALSAKVVGDKAALKKLEAIVHPLVRQAETAFLDHARDKGEKVVLLDIPLLFETGGEKRVDYTVVVSAPYDVQKERVLARPNMDEQKFAAILSRQMPDDEKRNKADFIIDTGKGRQYARRKVKAVLESINTR